MDARAEVKRKSFDDYGKAAATRFLKTAIVIDDHISAPVEPDEGEPIDAPPFAAMEALPAADDGAAPKPAGEGAPPESVSDLPIKPLADAFLDRQIVCGVLKPVDTDDDELVISRAVKAAEVADIVIVDWYLRGTDNRLALSILSRILQGDRDREGRLRLIVVYTSAAPLHERSKELAAHLAAEGIGCIPDPDDDTLIRAENCRIRFVRKPAGKEGKPVSALPDLAVEEFSQLSSGLLSNFALLGIGALRDATHHLLATFDRRLDPAFVGHRMLLTDPGDAHGFAMSLLMLQIKSILTLPNRLGGSLGHEEIEAWFDHGFTGQAVDEQLAAMNVGKGDLKTSALKGGCTVPRFHPALFVPSGGGDAIAAEKTATEDFARLATFAREFKGFSPLPRGWLPSLTLGTLVRTTGENPRYFLCVQPACDTVRIEEARHFPFIELAAVKKKKGDNIVVQVGDERLLLNVLKTPGARHYDLFQPNSESKTVRAVVREENGVITGFTFLGGEDRTYEWVGDIDSNKAQRIAVDLASTLARVGVDDYEWLRRGGSASG